MVTLDSLNSPLGKKFARHLLRRASFKYTKSLIDQFALLTPKQAIDVLIKPTTDALEKPYDPQPRNAPDGYFTDIKDLTSVVNLPRSLSRKNSIITGWWWYNALNSGGLNYKLSHFLSTRFTIQKNTDGTRKASEFYDYIKLALFYSYGSYKTYAKKMCLDNSMSVYLSNTFNISNSPNENFAREFFELFTIGKGKQLEPGNYTNYTEKDIVEAAKLLSGFKRRSQRDIIDTETSIPKVDVSFGQHNKEVKKFSAAFKNKSITSATNAIGMEAELDEFIGMVFSEIETAKHFCRKLYQYFVSSKINEEIENDIITPLANDFYNNNYEILPIVRKLLESKHFYDLDDSNPNDEIIGAIIKSPLQLFSEVCSYFNCTFPNPTTNPFEFYINFWNSFAHDSFFGGSNMPPFDPETVAGYPAYHQAPEYDKTWISSSTLIARYKMGESLLDKVDRITGGTKPPDIGAFIDIVKVLKDGLVSNPADPNILCKELCENLFGQEPDAARINYYKNNFLLNDVLENLDFYWTFEWNKFISTSDKSIVEPRLKNLVKKIVSAPEFQLF